MSEFSENGKNGKAVPSKLLRTDESGYIKNAPFNAALNRPEISHEWLTRMALEGKLSELQMQACRAKIGDFDEMLEEAKSQKGPNGSSYDSLYR